MEVENMSGTTINEKRQSIYKKIFYNFNTYVILAFICYLICLYSQRDFITADTEKQITWWNHILENGFKGISTLNLPAEAGGIDGDYTPVWYFISWVFIKIGMYPELPIQYNIKIMAIICSMISAITVRYIVSCFRPKAKYMPDIAMIVTLFSPAFFLDVVKANLPDSAYLMFVLLAVLSFIKNKKPLAWVWLGFGICLKAMTFFIIPIFIYFYLKDFEKYKLREKLSPFFCLISMALCSIPSILSGGDWKSGVIEPLFMRADAAMSLNSYSLWQLMPNDVKNFKTFSIGLILIIFAFIFFFMQKFVPEPQQKEVEYAVLPVLFPMICYYLLPAQHEGYFAISAMFSFIVWCIKPQKKYFLVFMALNLILFIAYCSISFRWWYGIEHGRSIVYDYQLMSLLFASVMIYLFYLIYKSSTFYSKRNIQVFDRSHPSSKSSGDFYIK